MTDNVNINVCQRCGDLISVCLARLNRLYAIDDLKLQERLKEHGHLGHLQEPKPEVKEFKEPEPIKIIKKRQRNPDAFKYLLCIRISKRQKQRLEEEAKAHLKWFNVQSVVRGLIDSLPKYD